MKLLGRIAASYKTYFVSFFFQSILGFWCPSVLGGSAEDEKRVQELVRRLKDPSWGVRRHAAEALWKMEEHAESVVLELAAALKGPNREVQWMATQALGEMGARAKGAVSDLVSVFMHFKDEKSQRVVSALNRLLSSEEKSPSAFVSEETFGADFITELQKIAVDRKNNPGFRVDAIELLGKMGGRALGAVEGLLDIPFAFLGENHRVYTAAREAVVSIQNATGLHARDAGRVSVVNLTRNQGGEIGTIYDPKGGLDTPGAEENSKKCLDGTLGELLGKVRAQ